MVNDKKFQKANGRTLRRTQGGPFQKLKAETSTKKNDILKTSLNVTRHAEPGFLKICLLLVDLQMSALDLIVWAIHEINRQGGG